MDPNTLNNISVPGMQFYRLRVIGKEGMYSVGGYARTPELSLLYKENLRHNVGTEILGIEATANPEAARLELVLIACEAFPGEWGVR